MATNPDATIIIEGEGGTSQNLSSFSTLSLPNVIEGTDGADVISGTPGDDEIRAKGGDDTIFGSTGNDTIDGGDGFDTIDYTFVGKPVTLFPRGGVGGEPGGLGGQIIDVERIVGSPGQANTIDGSSGTGGAFFDINLKKNQLVVKNVPVSGSLEFVVENFVNVTGTPNNDKIIGNHEDNILKGKAGDDVIKGKGGNDTIEGNRGDDTLRGNDGNDTLTGGLGNDKLFGGNGNDVLLGAAPLAKNPTVQKDVLTGGEGSDKFILGNEKGSFYDMGGNKDFAVIKDFDLNGGEQIQVGTDVTFRTELTKSGFNLFALNKDMTDLIAKVNFATEQSLGSAPAKDSNMATARVAEFSLLATDTTALIPEGDFQLGSGETLGVFVG